MLMVRLQRVGRKHEPLFRLVLTDSKNGPKSGKFLEILGSFDARKSEDAKFDIEKVKFWMSKGAKLSDTVHNLLVERKVIEGKKINNLPKKTPTTTEKAGAESVKSSQPSQDVTVEQAVEPKEEKLETKVASETKTEEMAEEVA